MSGFSTDWLAQREPFDLAAREASGRALAAARPPGTLQVLDLGCGTGSTVRALAPRLGGHQRWHVVDHDARLLAAMPGVLAGWAQALGLRSTVDGDALRFEGQGLRVDIVRLQADLATQLDRLPFDGAALVTSSALLDLVSEPWLARLVALCRAAGAAVCWALDVDGRLQWSPPDMGDAELLGRFGQHQRRDKGFGPALGPSATDRADALLRAAGYRTERWASDWRIDAGRGQHDRAMLQALLQGMAQAAREQAPEAAPFIQAWHTRRTAMLDETALCVGHADLLGWPAAR